MKTTTALLALALLAGCSSPSGDQAMATPASADPAAPAATTETPAARPATATASATGVVESVDTSARTITIAHGPVEALKWPAMTMAFQAPDADLASLAPGDRVVFEFTATGMRGTITRIAPR